MYLLYAGLLFLSLIVVLPVYAFRLRVRRGEPLHLRARLGLVRPAPRGGRPFLWIHAVSVGEVLSLRNLLREVRAAHPGWEIGLSTLTHTGQDVARDKLEGIDHLFFIPFDFGLSVRRVFARLQPSLLVLAESEYWPRLLLEAERRGCPVLVVNGRVSDRSGRRFQRLRALARIPLSKVTRFLVQTSRDGERLARVGVPAGRIRVAGNLKCDTGTAAPSAAEVAAFRASLGIPPESRVVVAGSIHPGEETTLLEAFEAARARRPGLRMILAPRHPGKFAGLEASLPSGGPVLSKRTRLESGQGWDILLLDTIGELARVYAASDVAFIGGSLVPHGGQNLLEPAVFGKPVVFGPHMENFASLAATFVEGGGARVVRTAGDLADVFAFEDPEATAAMGRRAREILTSLQGATARTLEAIEELMESGRV